MRRAICHSILVSTFLVSTGFADEMVCRTYIPTAERPHGEVRLVRRDGAVVVQTLLYTPSLRRGLQKIRQREEGNWPPGRTGHADSRKYLEVLAQGKTRSLESFERRADPEDANQKLLIEVTQDGESGSVSVSLPALAGERDALAIRAAEPVAASPVSVAYARGSMEIILRAAFHRPGSTLEEFLSGDALRFDPLTEADLQQPVTR